MGQFVKPGEDKEPAVSLFFIDFCAGSGSKEKVHSSKRNSPSPARNQQFAKLGVDKDSALQAGFDLRPSYTSEG